MTKKAPGLVTRWTIRGSTQESGRRKTVNRSPPKEKDLKGSNRREGLPLNLEGDPNSSLATERKTRVVSLHWGGNDGAEQEDEPGKSKVPHGELSCLHRKEVSAKSAASCREVFEIPKGDFGKGQDKGKRKRLWGGKKYSARETRIPVVGSRKEKLRIVNPKFGIRTKKTERELRFTEKPRQKKMGVLVGGSNLGGEPTPRTHLSSGGGRSGRKTSDHDEISPFGERRGGKEGFCIQELGERVEEVPADIGGDAQEQGNRL